MVIRPQWLKRQIMLVGSGRLSRDASGFQEPSQSIEDDHEVVDNETYLKEMEIDSNWQIPREKLEITRDKLGRGEFGVLYKGFYLRRGGSKMPVAVKCLRGLCATFFYM
jgi:hypothetical protein